MDNERPDHAATISGAPDVSDPQAWAEIARVAEPATLRRAPRYGAFIAAGGLLGLVAAIVVSLVAPTAADGGRWAYFAYVAVIAVVLFGVVGAVVAVLLDRPGRAAGAPLPRPDKGSDSVDTPPAPEAPVSR